MVNYKRFEQANSNNDYILPILTDIYNNSSDYDKLELAVDSDNHNFT